MREEKENESIELDITIVKYGHDNVLNKDHENYIKIHAFKPLFKKMNTFY